MERGGSHILHDAAPVQILGRKIRSIPEKVNPRD
jgi:hypothetical protein